jgi:Ni/Co efflux regulator RcnB
MVNMKKIVGILLALCFVLSVTAASAAASEDKDHGALGDHPKKDDDKDRFKEHNKKDDDKDRFKENNKKRHHHPGHWEKKRVGHREFRNNQWMMVYVYEMVYFGPTTHMH